MTFLNSRLSRRENLGNLRKLQTFHSLIDFASNDYLGLARSPKFAKSVAQERKIYAGPLNGLGSTGSRLLTGNSNYIQELEEKIAAFHGYESGLLFNCGYMANMGLLTAIANRKSVVFFDAAIHASTHDGIRLSRAQAFPFRHNDLEHLEHRLKYCLAPEDRFICIESIYSTDGSTAPLVELSQLSRKYGAHLIVDEAHAVGACGPQGRGLIAEHNLTPYVFAQVITFGKALGTYGAMILGSSVLIQALLNFATPYIYTTALPYQMLSAIKCSYDLFPKMDQERVHLQRLVQNFREIFPKFSPTHIQPVPAKGNERVLQASLHLAKQGFDVRPLMSPTVRQGREMLRICFHAHNTKEEVAGLLHHLQLNRSFTDA